MTVDGLISEAYGIELVYWGFWTSDQVGGTYLTSSFCWTKQLGNWEVTQKKWCPIPPARKKTSPIAVNTWGDWGVANNSGTLW